MANFDVDNFYFLGDLAVKDSVIYECRNMNYCLQEPTSGVNWEKGWTATTYSVSGLNTDISG
jgi:hypothetical protein